MAVAADGSRRPVADVTGVIALTVRTGSPTQPPYVHVRALPPPGHRSAVGAGSRGKDTGAGHSEACATDVAEGNHAALAFFQRAGYYEERGMLVKISASSQSVRT
ncbi:MAG: hypothetical protein OXE05_13545 [Chloroflexi bacterium]|nr:hypothetical protein [Chloroflexota bacterium]